MPVSANCLLYKNAVGTVVNMGCPKKPLEESLRHDRKTLNRWSGAMKETDPDKFIRMLNGQGAQQKLSLIEEGQRKSLYFEHCDKKQYVKIIRRKFEKQTRKNIISRKTYYTYFKRFQQAAAEPEPVQSRKAAEAKDTQFAPRLSSIFPESVTYFPAPGEVPIVPEEGEFKHLPDFSQVVSFPRYYHNLRDQLLLLRHVIFSPGQVITDKQGCHYIMIWPSMRLGDNKLHRSLNRLCRQINQIIA